MNYISIITVNIKMAITIKYCVCVCVCVKNQHLILNNTHTYTHTHTHTYKIFAIIRKKTSKWKQVASLHTSELLHHIEVLQIKQLPNPGVVGEVVHGKANYCIT